ncbi:mitochondrial membrane protein [Malassezia yamatoensis]|uniref:Mitochondrial fission 1 protein n=1 Tax=Malassezia yamatoensis TaxID=253288 RepID=A0AAJ5YVL2_9BASI|nr:mitochondrial membrane protein [Malassezia yamatoensis]
MTLPYVVDAHTSLSAAELQVLREQYDSETASGHTTTQTKFNYAWALIKSPNRPQMLQGVALLTDLLLEREPNNLQAQSLNALIEKGIAREGYIGMALLGGAATVAGVVVTSLLRRGRR